MSMTDPITPPDELLEHWREVGTFGNWRNAFTLAARWGHQQRVRSSPESPLVERVADAVAAQATSAGIVNDRPARAAQAVYTAVLEISPAPADEIAAATLRAAAGQLDHSTSQHRLFAIAAELEGTNG